ncbi:NUDIX domain-containing protein [Streptomyces catenulae]|uniref:NUDIX domain-containing protein n=1 Tax=Streptomyces catenulae TaxID=66875 RepID=A0ABV2YU94_9ACTN|nr:NUDIX domain-containing protein [Streptomyces catenulae]
MPLPGTRVVAYVLLRRAVPELLVFDRVGPAGVGTRGPAGGAGPGEGPERAVLREVAGEVGPVGVTVVRRIAVEDRPHPHPAQPRRTTFFLLRAPDGTPDAG